MEAIQAGQLIVVGEHQFAHGDGVVLIDNRNDAVLQHMVIQFSG